MNNDHLTYRIRIIQSLDQIFSVSEVSMVRCPVWGAKPDKIEMVRDIKYIKIYSSDVRYDTRDSSLYKV
jgi:hypothetical protein